MKGFLRCCYAWPPSQADVHYSPTDTLLTPLNPARWQVDPKCPLCGNPRPTTAHVLNGCQRALKQGRFSWRHDCILACIILFQILEEDSRSIESRSLDCTFRSSKGEVNSTSRETFRLENSCFFRDLAGICCEVSKADLTIVTTDWKRLGIALFQALVQGRRKESLVHTVRACARFPW